MVKELREKDEENKHLKKCVKNRDDITNSLDDMFKMDKIRNLRENCDSLAKQIGKELILENKSEIQNTLINELKINLIEAKETARVGPMEEIEKLIERTTLLLP